MNAFSVASMLFLILFGLLKLCIGAAQTSFQYRLAIPETFFDIPNHNLHIPQTPSEYRKLDDSLCPPKQVLNIDGSCSTPDITQKFFVYGSPTHSYRDAPRPKPTVPKPKIEYNVVVIKSSETKENPDPIVIPPPQQKTVVLVLNKESNNGKRKIIEIDYPVDNPEVFFVNYKDGDNIDLPGGIDLKTALEAAVSGNAEVFGNRNSVGDFLGSDRRIPYEHLSRSTEYANTFKRSAVSRSPQESFLPPYTQPLSYTANLPSAEQQLGEWSCPTCLPYTNRLDSFPLDARGIVPVQKKRLRLPKLWKERPHAPRHVFTQRKPSQEEKKASHVILKKALITRKRTIGLPPTKKDSKEWSPFVPSNRVYASGRVPIAGLWKRLNKKDGSTTISDLNEKFIKQVKYSARYRLSPTTSSA